MEEHESEHSHIGYQTAVRWLGLGQVLKRVWDLRAQIQESVVGRKGRTSQSSDTHWMADLASAVDVTTLMKELHTKLQGKCLFPHELYSLVTAFMKNSLSHANTERSHTIN